MTNEQPPSLKERTREYVDSLLKLAAQDDRGALAALRRGLGQPPGSVPAMHPYVADFLTDWEATHREGFPSEGFPKVGQWFYVVGALFALHPKHDNSRSLGKSLAAIKSDSMDLRITALLNTHPHEMPDQLRRVVALLKANETAINWYQLLIDLLAWSHPDRYVQRNWAYHYFSTDAKENA